MIKYLTSAEFAERIGVSPNTIRNYKLPEPDAITGRIKGWLPETIDQWHKSRPSQIRNAVQDNSQSENS